MRFDMICEANDIEHRLTKALPSSVKGPNHPYHLDQRTSRADELHDQGGDRQTLPLR